MSKGDGGRPFRALSDPYRRHILLHLLEHEALEVSTAVDMGETDSERAKIALHHKHLPHLESGGYIRWDREQDTVTKGPEFEELRIYLESLGVAEEGVLGAVMLISGLALALSESLPNLVGNLPTLVA